jgi:hypothetical protein
LVNRLHRLTGNNENTKIMDVSFLQKWIDGFIGAARTMLLGIVTLATLLFSGCTSGGGGARASFISPSDGHQDSFGMGQAAQSSAIVDWSRPANEQPGIDAPQFGGRGVIGEEMH